MVSSWSGVNRLRENVAQSGSVHNIHPHVVSQMFAAFAMVGEGIWRGRMAWEAPLGKVTWKCPPGGNDKGLVMLVGSICI